MRRARLLLALAVTAVATAAAAQLAPPRADDAAPITVTAGRATRDEIRARATAFVRATGVAAGEVAAARWVEPVCPRVVGLTDAAATLVETTLRRVAADAGIAVAPAVCTANIAIVFTTDAAATVGAMASRHPRVFARMPAAAVAKLASSVTPIRWWYQSEVRDRDGMPASSSSPPPGIFGGAEGGGTVLPGTADTTFVQHYSTSVVSTESMRALRTATVVVDVTRTDGLPLSAVASYAAMVALAEFRPGATPPDSVLDLFAGGPVRRSPSAWDVAFLRALYRLPLDRTAVRQRGRLVADLVTAAVP